MEFDGATYFRDMEEDYWLTDSSFPTTT